MDIMVSNTTYISWQTVLVVEECFRCLRKPTTKGTASNCPTAPLEIELHGVEYRCDSWHELVLLFVCIIIYVLCVLDFSFHSTPWKISYAKEIVKYEPQETAHQIDDKKEN